MRRGYTLIEMLTTVAALVILLALMVSLARYVRDRSAQDLTRQVLSRLNLLLAQYGSANDSLSRSVPRLIPRSDQKVDETALGQAAADNNRAFVKFFRQLSGDQAFARLPGSVYDGMMLRDAWGTPIVFMPSGAPNVGISPQGRAFFFSAGPDRKFSTALDNQYSYERSWDKAAGQRE
jgi:prepilin-type N-terminal cleavage/methylation domain-containing protein